MILQSDRVQKYVAPVRTTRWLLRGATVPNGDPASITISSCPFRIGRTNQNDLSIVSPVVSSRHAEILESAGILFIRDTASTNGTFVNGKRITNDTLLTEGDLIEIGDTFFRVLTDTTQQADHKTNPVLGKTHFFQDSHDMRGPRSMQTLLQDGNLLPCFQAIHCLNSGLIRGYEYLARCNYPGIETAGQLFEQARRAGREIELSLLCRHRAMEFSSNFDENTPVFLNTHPAEPLLETVVPQMRELRRLHPNRKIVLEIHEASITEPALVKQLRRDLAESDVRLAFDDFGRGQARIRELICVPSDYIKFDSSLIYDLESVSPEQFRFFRSIIQGIKNEGAITVAEGVETETMAQICRDIGFDLVQGFLFSRPTLLTLD